jgi:hypothetical protein
MLSPMSDEKVALALEKILGYCRLGQTEELYK